MSGIVSKASMTRADAGMGFTTFDDPYGEKMAPVPPPLPDYVLRMMEESKDLVVRLGKLSIDVGSKQFQESTQLEQRLMVEQMDAMEKYAKVLSLRYHMALLDAGR